VKVVLHTLTKGEQIEALRQRRITVGFNRMLAPLDDIGVVQVTTEGLLLAIQADDPLARQPVIRFAELQHHPLILFPTGARPSFIDKVIGLCSTAGFQPTISQEVGDAVTGVAWWRAASGSAWCPTRPPRCSFPAWCTGPSPTRPRTSSWT
jgi:DNA-binding transcriptional LysR family regulator